MPGTIPAGRGRLPGAAARAAVRSPPRGRRVGATLAGPLLAALLAAPSGAEGREERFSGVARGEGGAVRYLEEHVVQRDGDRLLSAVTTYRDPAGAVVARLETDFAADPFAPSYTFQDLRSGEEESVQVSGAGLRLATGGRQRVLPASGPHRLVTGQGLDRLAQARLEALAAGEVVAVTYAIPSRLDTFEFRLRAVGARPGGAVVRVRIELASALLRWLAPSLEVDYDRATRRLLRYRGVSNLSDDQGGRQEVEITYAYPEDRTAALAPPGR